MDAPRREVPSRRLASRVLSLLVLVLMLSFPPKSNAQFGWGGWGWGGAWGWGGFGGLGYGWPWGVGAYGLGAPGVAVSSFGLGYGWGLGYGYPGFIGGPWAGGYLGGAYPYGSAVFPPYWLTAYATVPPDSLAIGITPLAVRGLELERALDGKPRIPVAQLAPGRYRIDIRRVADTPVKSDP